MEVVVTPDALEEIARLPTRIGFRVRDVLARLANYPDVSGVKRLKGEWRGHFRARTGDYRIVFRLEGDQLIVVRVANRRDVYEE